MSAIPTNQATSQSLCVVSAQDYRKHFEGCEHSEAVAVIWNGEERRVGEERRRGTHDRRWDNANGRRWRLIDRRHVNASVKPSLRASKTR